MNTYEMGEDGLVASIVYLKENRLFILPSETPPDMDLIYGYLGKSVKKGDMVQANWLHNKQTVNGHTWNFLGILEAV